ncbi:high affinity cationic amino acid transporter 1-like [Pogonomyrmex barbatus]|uniref:High affinity cationic amino acid transporter 1-like n=1 Tax=Pogonomyrmex barbatus TaxID=144034 RepID=A0A6I9W499_9HYME|nr:high affinity cationic amino acid transporter 1-like [Pogonomyrmex barbatus]
MDSVLTKLIVLYKMKWKLRGLLKTFSRRKVVDTTQDSTLARVLTTLDLTALGIGSTLGVGVYVLAGSVAKNLAGPAVTISFAIAAVASMFAGLCYAEFGARVPRAGSAYVYSYVTMGEFVAFLMGWTLILEYIIGSASVVRALSTYVDVLFNDSMKNSFESAMPINVNILSSYPDFFALGVTLIFSVALAFGAKESSTVNNIFTLVNLSVVLFVIIAGSLKSDINNWKTKPGCTADSCENGDGGFVPYGVQGIISGAAMCFYGFIGFDCVATTGEEAKNPQRSIPIAIVASLTIVFLAYFGVSVVLTTVLPYYEQNPNSPFPHMFNVIGWDWAKYFVTAGAISGLCARVPLVPFLPGISILINIYLMMTLDKQTWIQFSVWIVIGLGIYFLYGMWHSNIGKKKSPESSDDDKNRVDFSHVT